MPQRTTRRFAFAGATAVVTGAASGIGQALTHALADRGCHLVLLDRDAPRLAAVAADVHRRHPDTMVDTRVVDLADAAATARVGAQVLVDHPRIRLLVNNAGVALAGRFDQVTIDEFEWVVEVNFLAVARLTHTLLPALRAEPGAHLVNVSSLFGLIAPAGQAAYAASKFAVRGFTEALRGELAGDGVTVTAVHPGGVRTAIAAAARTGSGVPEAQRAGGGVAGWLTMDPATAAGQIVRAVARRRRRVLIGWSTVALDVLARLMPGSYGRVLAALARAGRGRSPTPTPL